MAASPPNLAIGAWAPRWSAGGGESMRSSVFVLRWRRILVSLSVLALAGPLVVSEVYHLVTRGHLGLGLHSDVMSSYDAWGVPYYSLWTLNLTPCPVPVRVCIDSGDTGLSKTSYRSRKERAADSASRWENMWSTSPTCGGIPRGPEVAALVARRVGRARAGRRGVAVSRGGPGSIRRLHVVQSTGRLLAPGPHCVGRDRLRDQGQGALKRSRTAAPACDSNRSPARR